MCGREQLVQQKWNAGGEPQLCPRRPNSSELLCLSCGKAPEAARTKPRRLATKNIRDSVTTTDAGRLRCSMHGARGVASSASRWSMKLLRQEIRGVVALRRSWPRHTRREAQAPLASKILSEFESKRRLAQRGSPSPAPEESPVLQEASWVRKRTN